MYTNNDITKIDPPQTLADLTALDATREVPYLKARCNRMQIPIPSPNPAPSEILPHIQQTLARHSKDPTRDAGPMSGDFMEWKLIREEYEEFITYLKSLSSFPSFASVKHPLPTTTQPNPAPNANQSDAPCKPTLQIEPKTNQTRIKSEPNPNQK